MQPQSENLKTAVRGAYDIQKLRIQMGNRIVGNFKAKLGQEPGEKESTIDTEGKALLQAMRLAFKKLTDGVATFPRQSSFTGDEVISTYTELCLIAQYLDLEKFEDQHFRRLGNILKDYAIWCEFLEGVKGVGPAMAGVIISEIKIDRAKYPSSLWAYAGLDVAGDGRGRSRREGHLVEREYTTKTGTTDTRKSITFNPFLKTKLTGVLGPSFLKVGREKSPYAIAYYDYKHRMENHVKYGTANDGIKDDDGKQITSKGRRHNMAIRYAVKRFLVDLYIAWRKLEGLTVAPEYSEAKLNYKHGAA